MENDRDKCGDDGGLKRTEVPDTAIDRGRGPHHEGPNSLRATNLGGQPVFVEEPLPSEVVRFQGCYDPEVLFDSTADPGEAEVFDASGLTKEDLRRLFLGEFDEISNIVLQAFACAGKPIFVRAVPVRWVTDYMPADSDIVTTRVHVKLTPVNEGGGKAFLQPFREDMRLQREAATKPRFAGCYDPILDPREAVVEVGVRCFEAESISEEDLSNLFLGEFEAIRNTLLRDHARAGRPISFSGVPVEWVPYLIDPTRKTTLRRVDVMMSPVDRASAVANGDMEARRNGEAARRIKKIDRPVARVEHPPVAQQPGPVGKDSVDGSPEEQERIMREINGHRMSRRAVIGSLLLLVAAGSAYTMGQNPQASKSVRAWFKRVFGSKEAKEAISANTPFAALLKRGKKILVDVGENKMLQDNVLKTDAVIKYFLKGKFDFTGVEDAEFMGEEQEIYRFAMIGEKSGYNSGVTGAEKVHLQTTLADVVNILLETSTLTEQQIKEWVCWLYEKSFNTKLDIKRMSLQWVSKGVLKQVHYKPEDGFRKEPPITVALPLAPGEARGPYAALSKKTEQQKILASDGHLLLPSGLSPLHDVRVPESMLKKDPQFDLDLPKLSPWRGLSASHVSSRMGGLDERVKARGNARLNAKVFGRNIAVAPMAPLIERNDPMVKQLVEALLVSIDQNDHAKRIQTMVDFVQALPYRWEYDTNIDRPALVVLCNGGGDCNNLTDLFCEMMLVAGYDCGIMWVGFNGIKDADVTCHARAGVPGQYFPGKQSWHNDPKRPWVPIELTGDNTPVGDQPWGKNETTFLIEELFAERAKK